MKICIVGGGIIGLSTGLCLKKYGPRDLDVTIVTLVTTPDTTADGAAGIWGPYLLDETPIELQHRWAKETHDLVEDWWNSEWGGVMGISLVSSTRLNSSEDPPNWHDIVYGYRELSRKELNEFGRLSGSHSHGTEFVTYTIEPVKLLPFILKEFMALGGKLVTGKHVKAWTDLDENFDLIINCTGVWAKFLANDDRVEPLRGQVMRVLTPGLFRVILDDADDGNYIIPNQDSTVLGGTHQRDWNTNPDPEDRRFILEGAKKLMPGALKDVEVIKDWVGLRPGRASVRLERQDIRLENGKQIQVIHNYGHGGSGITIFWGCAKDVLKLVQEIRNERRRPQSKL